MAQKAVELPEEVETVPPVLVSAFAFGGAVVARLTEPHRSLPPPAAEILRLERCRNERHQRGGEAGPAPDTAGATLCGPQQHGRPRSHSLHRR